jgi:hypothetical protein
VPDAQGAFEEDGDPYPCEEDEEFFRYKQALQEYNSEPLPSLTLPKKERYEKGSLL